MSRSKVSLGKKRFQQSILAQICVLADQTKATNRNPNCLPHKFHQRMVEQFKTVYPNLNVNMVEITYRKHCKAKSTIVLEESSSSEAASPTPPTASESLATTRNKPVIQYKTFAQKLMSRVL